MFMCVSCFGLVFSTCRVIGEKDSSEDAYGLRGKDRDSYNVQVVCV